MTFSKCTLPHFSNLCIILKTTEKDATQNGILINWSRSDFSGVGRDGGVVKANEQGSDNESPISLQDESYAKGLAFEEFIVKRFDTNFFTVKEWRGDKQVDGVYALSLSI